MLATTKVQLYLLVGHSAVHSVTKGQKGGQPDDNVQSAMYWFGQRVGRCGRYNVQCAMYNVLGKGANNQNGN